MKHATILLAALCFATGAAAQTTARIHRTEVVPYDTRHDAEARIRARSSHAIDFRPETRLTTEGPLWAIVGQTIKIPYVWTDGLVYLHLENLPTAGSLRINGREVATVHDPLTPAEFDITPYVRQGVNDFKVLLHDDSPMRKIDPQAATKRAEFDGSYLYYQNKRSIRDFRVELVPDSLGRKFGMLDLQIVVQNGFNYDEQVAVGYDIYSPEGKLLDYNIVETTVPGNSVDTLHFQPFIYGAYNHCWEAGAKRPSLYKVMLFTRRDEAYKEYMPLKVGFGKTELVDGKLLRFGKELALKCVRYNAAADAKTTATQLATLRKQGYNTLEPDYPQPAWFYELCDAEGMYVIDKAAIDAPEHRADRSIGGTPSNDPTLAQEYLERVQAMYYRSRNFTCVIAYALGSPSGNGYNMYKAYEWLKSVEPSRPILYEDADGEWNTDRCKSN
ncbi:MAG: hypothetical protein NC250_00355 [Alistipes senegalensis]|nr:hypothetical protein [Bacteroides cellulosilyticus]MCM1351174.1 hypothetical protein [Alistipes senegalensis]